MDLRQLAHVVAVIEHGGFTKAAAALHIAQPSLSQSIAALEHELGVLLFDRIGRGVQPTAAGRALLEPARQALRDMDVARAAVTAVTDLSRGHLDLVCLATLAVDPVADLVGEYRRRHGGVTVALAAPEDVASLEKMVRSGVAEIGINELGLSGGDFVEIEMAAQRYVALMPSDWSQVDWSQSDAVSLASLARLPLITTPPGTSTRRLVDAAFEKAGHRPTVAVETAHRDAIAALVRSGSGYAIVPRNVADRNLDPAVRIVPIRPAITRRVGLLHRSAPLSPAGLAFIELIAARPHPARQ